MRKKKNKVEIMNEAHAIANVTNKPKLSKLKSVNSAVTKQKKVNREMLIASVAARTGMTQAAISTVFDAYQEEIIDRVTNNEEVSITGFGRFYIQRHKGHPVQFSNVSETVHDYVVFKFSASNVLNNKLRTLDSICRLES